MRGLTYMETKELIFQDLTAEHLFLFCDVIEAIGLEEFASAFSNGDENSASTGFKIGSVIVKGLKQSKTQIYKFFEGCTNYSYEEISNMELVPFTKMIKKFAKKPELADFFTEVTSLLNMEK